MSWRDKLRTASFRGASFKVSEADTQVGRRNILHQYPLKDTPYLEDLGQDADSFRITGYVIQNTENDFDYFTERDALIDALKKEGSGTLVHPFLGEFQVGLVGRASIKESFQRQGVAVFEMQFVLSGKKEYPSELSDVEGYIDSIAEEAEQSWIDSFVEFFNVDGVMDYIYDSGLGDLIMFSRDIYDAVSKVVDKASQAAAYVLQDLYEIRQEWTYVLSQPEQISEKIQESYQAFTDLFGLTGDLAEEEDSSDEYKTQIADSSLSLASWDNTEEPLTDEDVTTVNRALQYRNRAVLVNLVRGLALTTTARVAVRVEYDSWDSAQEMKQNVVEAIDAQLEKVGDEVDDVGLTDYDEVTYNNDPAYTALLNLRAAFSQAMDVIGADLAKIVEYTVPPTVISSLVLAYDRYKDIDRGDNIFNRNKPLVQHPGFLPEGQPIELLNK